MTFKSTSVLKYEKAFTLDTSILEDLTNIFTQILWVNFMI